MIDSAVMFYKGRILVQSNVNLDEKNLNVVKSALTQLSRKSVSKVVQLGKLRMGISSFKYKTSTLAFGVFGSEVQPKVLLDCSGDLAETFVQNFSKQDIEHEGTQISISKEFETVVIDYNKKINKNKETLIEIDQNLQEGIDISKQSIQKFMERKDYLQNMESLSSSLSKQAMNFQSNGRRLKNDVMRQKMKIYLICGVFVFLSLFFIFKRI